jgi:8-oxo-dGTP pyrophosphatase MutT (NUDIX family)
MRWSSPATTTGSGWSSSSAIRWASGAGNSRRAPRELREETGLRAGSFVRLGQLDVAPGMSSQRGWVFLATNITEGEPDREHEEQDMRSAWFSREQVEAMIRSGEITDAQSIAAFAQFLLTEW